jgi:flagellar motor switch protein FliN/FliY
MDAEQPKPSAADPAATPSAAAPASSPEQIKAAEAAIAEARAKNAPSATPLSMPDFGPKVPGAKPEGIDLLADVNLQVKIELGRTRMLVEDVLRLGEGSVVELDKLAGDPVDVFVNDRRVARGEVLVLNDNFCVRINEILAPVGPEGTK